MQQRHYDPQAGRFLSVDPVQADANTGANFNRYWYANDNPYRYTDPDGRCVDGLTCGPMVQSYAADEMAHPNRPLTPVDKAILVTGGAAVAVVGGAEVGAAGVVRAAVRYVGAKIASTAVRQAAKDAPGLSKIKVRSDVVLHGGRSGQNVKDLVGPPNAVVKGGGGRAFVTNEKGQVVLDITKNRVKPITPGKGFGPKRVPTPEELKLRDEVHGG